MKPPTKKRGAARTHTGAVRIRVELATRHHEAKFLAAVARSHKLHGSWVAAPATPSDYRAYVAVLDARRLNYLVIEPVSAEIAGVINLNEIVRGRFRSAYLGYYAFSPYARRGYMTAGLARVIGRAFGVHRLHRLEANIQPDNRASLALARRLGFRREGFSPRYLKIAGRWRDHERWAITQEDWRARPRPFSAGSDRGPWF